MSVIQHILAYAIAGGFFGILVMFMGGPEKLWETVDISDNLKKATRAMKTIDNGAVSLIYAVCFALPAVIGFGILAWHFDLASSWDAMATLRKEVEKSMTGELASYSVFVFAVLTYLPTILEMFGAKFARFNLHIIQAVTLALAIFDLFTDLPRVRAFMEPHYSFFVNDKNTWLMNSLYEGLYYILFGLWWFLASYGFELLFVVCLWTVIGFALKGIKGQRRQRVAFVEE